MQLVIPPPPYIYIYIYIYLIINVVQLGNRTGSQLQIPTHPSMGRLLSNHSCPPSQPLQGCQIKAGPNLLERVRDVQQCYLPVKNNPTIFSQQVSLIHLNPLERTLMGFKGAGATHHCPLGSVLNKLPHSSWCAVVHNLPMTDTHPPGSVLRYTVMWSTVRQRHALAARKKQCRCSGQNMAAFNAPLSIRSRGERSMQFKRKDAQWQSCLSLTCRLHYVRTQQYDS